MMTLRREAGALVDLLLHGDAFDDVAELHRPATSVRIGMVYGSHSASSSPLFTASPVVDLELGAVHDRVALALALAARLGIIDDRELAVAVHDDEVAVLVRRRC